MTIEYAAVWDKLPATYRTRFLTHPAAPLVADDVAVLTRAGAVTLGAYWTDSGPETVQWWISDGFKRFIRQRIEARRTEIWQPHVEAAKVPLTDSGESSGPLPQADLDELAALDAALAELDES